jgi:oxygen-dependent protoporphyrinogen oxidase
VTGSCPAPDVLIVGGGIAGLSAGWRLRERGLRALVLEAAPRVGGRMTTDRVNGYAIDTGVTLLGNRFRGMRALVRRSSLTSAPVPFSLALQDARGLRSYRARRALDLLFGSGLSLAARLAALRLLTGIAWSGRSMLHGNSDQALELDRESVAEYFQRLGRGGLELFAKVFEPGLRAALGGAPGAASRWVLMQVVWNTLAAGFWNFDGGVDRLPEALAPAVATELGARVHEVRLTRAGPARGVEIDVTSDRSRTLHARAVIFAVPGNQLPALFPSAPGWLRETAAHARFSRLMSAHVALSRPPACPHPGYGFAHAPEAGVGVLELEHLRAPGRCPEGKAMVSVYFTDSPEFRCLDADDGSARARAVGVVERTFPECRGAVEFVHLVRWPAAIAQFPKGRLMEVVALRQRLARSDVPFDVAGDWLDGVASESAVQTGIQAADRVARRLAS